MSFSLLVLNTIFTLTLPFLFFVFILPNLARYIKRGRKTFFERFYLKARNLKKGGIVIFSSSVGEGKIAIHLARTLRKTTQKSIYALVETPEAKKILKKSSVFDNCFLAPVDIFFVVKSFFKKLKPSLLILIELGIWPNLIEVASKTSKIVIVNGRISKRSFPRYRVFKFLIKKLLKKISLICARTKTDARRFVKLGAEERKVFITGNLKYDLMFSNIEKHEIPIKKEGKKIIVAGSTHRGEEEAVVDAVLNLKRDDVFCVIAPRHIERADEVKALLQKRGISALLLSEYKNRHGKNPQTLVNFLVVDKMGYLMDFYRIADICFVGGSLIPHGGQNFLEAIFLKKPVCVGKYNDNFKFEFEFFKDDIYISQTPQNLKRIFEKIFENPENADMKAKRAYEKLKTLTGKTERYLSLLEEFL